MKLTQLRVRGYRSVRDVEIQLAPATVVVGPNGCGKTNLYRGIYLLAAAASGRFARTLADEGGMPSAAWAGERGGGPVRITLTATFENAAYEMSVGLPVPYASRFALDPVIKEEHLWVTERGHKIKFLERGNATAIVRDADGQRVTYPLSLNPAESVLAQITEPHRYPELSMVRHALLSWRFYHQFRTDADSPMRHPHVGIRTPVMANDGRDLAAALQTILESANDRKLHEAIGGAFSSARVAVDGEQSNLRIRLHSAGMNRPLDAHELSDGTLRYLCLAAALLTLDPPPLLVLNEPETSLHADLLEPLGRLIAANAARAQIWVTTHAMVLARTIESQCPTSLVQLAIADGATRVVRGASDDDDDSRDGT